MTKTSHKKNRPFDFKLIDLVEPHQVLYQRQLGLSTFEYMKMKNKIWKKVAAEMGVDIDFCISRWSNLRCQFQKELRACRELCPKLGIIKGSTWPYLERLRFLEGTIQFNRPKRIKVPKRKKMQEKQDLDPDEDIFTDDTESANSSNSAKDEDGFMGFADNEPVEDTMVSEEGHFNTVNNKEQVTEKRTMSNFLRMAALLEGIDNENRARVERRILAFLCKCQLRALVSEDVDDLIV